MPHGRVERRRATWRWLGQGLAWAAALVAAVSCEPPPQKVIGAAQVDLPPRLAQLPAPVQATLARLRTIAEQGGYRDLAKLAETTPDFRSNAGGMRHIDYWRLKTRAGDDPTLHLKKILAYAPAKRRTSAGVVYVWPGLAALRPEAMTQRDADAVDALLGPGEGAARQRGAPWTGYSLAIREDGAWLYFVAGAG